MIFFTFSEYSQMTILAYNFPVTLLKIYLPYYFIKSDVKWLKLPC